MVVTDDKSCHLSRVSYISVIDQACSLKIYGLLLVRSRWLNIGQVLFLRIYGP